ncbi:Yip1 family protein [Streptomyces pathocidini]|uniref:Yip1 family protein n=1 Tax=Streptomyces pathocidini TaxID=1650571 RepID=A0ABW7UNR2_9ACTN|nr:Yip1 family protein [Streptomyces pathocidini]
MARFRMGRGRDSAQQQGQQPYGQQVQQPYAGQPVPPHAQQWSYGGGQGGSGREEPEYFGPANQGHDPYAARPQQGHDPYAGHPQQGHDPFANNPGHTRAFTVGGAGEPYAQDRPYDPYGGPQGPDGNVSTYRAGHATAPPSGPRLHWKQLLSGVLLRPGPTFWQMRDYPMWGPALIVTFLYGLFAVFGLDQAREDVLNATLSNSIPWVISTGIAVVISGLLLGAVTHTLARQLGGDGSWQPTVGLSMLIMSLTDAPRLLFAMFLGGDSALVQVLGWATWFAAAALFTSMVSKSHDLPWPKALGAASIQLVALLALIKLGTL